MYNFEKSAVHFFPKYNALFLVYTKPFPPYNPMVNYSLYSNRKVVTNICEITVVRLDQYKYYIAGPMITFDLLFLNTTFTLFPDHPAITFGQQAILP